MEPTTRESKKIKAKKVKTKHMDPKILELRKTLQISCGRNDLRTAKEAFDRLHVKEGVKMESQSYYNLLNLCEGLSEHGVHIGTPKIPKASSVSIDPKENKQDTEEQLPKDALVKKAMLFLNSPYLWGGRTPFGIDCSGFTQMVYRLCGHHLLRDAKEQATQGEVLSFIEESEAGDLAFFDNAEGNITHVGIIMNDYKIIHAHGKVRIDTLDHSGIYNVDLQKHTHKLRVIKKITS